MLEGPDRVWISALAGAVCRCHLQWGCQNLSTTERSRRSVRREPRGQTFITDGGIFIQPFEGPTREARMRQGVGPFGELYLYPVQWGRQVTDSKHQDWLHK